MEFEWDPEKDRSNKGKHGIDFASATRVFRDPRHITIDSTRPDHGETRMKAVGLVEDRLMVVIFTDRGANRRIISARRARPNERRDYDQGQAGT